MLHRSAPSGEDSQKRPDTVHSHGPKNGDHERMIVCLLGSTREVPAALAYRAICDVLGSMNGHAPEGEVEPVSGGIRLGLGRTTYAFAQEIAETIQTELIRTQDELSDEDRGVGVSVKVVSFPHKEGGLLE